jgi:hypothetical protein
LQLRIQFKDNIEDVYEYPSEASLLRDLLEQEIESKSSDGTTNGTETPDDETNKANGQTTDSITSNTLLQSADQPPPVPKRTKTKADNGPLRQNTSIGSSTGNSSG